MTILPPSAEDVLSPLRTQVDDLARELSADETGADQGAKAFKIFGKELERGRAARASLTWVQSKGPCGIQPVRTVTSPKTPCVIGLSATTESHRVAT